MFGLSGNFFSVIGLLKRCLLHELFHVWTVAIAQQLDIGLLMTHQG